MTNTTEALRRASDAASSGLTEFVQMTMTPEQRQEALREKKARDAYNRGLKVTNALYNTIDQLRDSRGRW